MEQEKGREKEREKSVSVIYSPVSTRVKITLQLATNC